MAWLLHEAVRLAMTRVNQHIYSPSHRNFCFCDDIDFVEHLL